MDHRVPTACTVFVVLCFFYKDFINITVLKHYYYILLYLIDNMSLDQLLDQQPPIQEITTHARTEKWNELDTQLQLDIVNLADCHCLTSMYQIWIQEKADKATSRSLLNPLRTIKQNNVVMIYEDYLINGKLHCPYINIYKYIEWIP